MLDDMLPNLAQPVQRLKLQVSSCRDAGCNLSWPVPRRLSSRPVFFRRRRRIA